MLEVEEICSLWWRAEKKLQQQHKSVKGIPSPSMALINEVYGMLACISWARNLCRFSFTYPISSLTRYLTTEWLTDDHEAQMLEILKAEVTCKRERDVQVQTIYFFKQLNNAYKEHTKYLSKKSLAWL